MFRAHCLLSQSAISDGTAEMPADSTVEILRTILDAQVGVVQMPCTGSCAAWGWTVGDPEGGERPGE